MSATKAPAKAKAPVMQAPVSNFAAFVKGDIKGGEHAHAYRKSVVRTALEQAFKGNYSPLTEALALCAGKAKKARAYLAGFAAAGVHSDPLQSTVRKVPYKGALSAPDNADARATIEARTAEAFAAFFAAFDTVMAEPGKARAPKAAAEPEATSAPADSGDATNDTDSSGADSGVTVTEIEPAALVESIADALTHGMLTAEEVLILRTALAVYDTEQAVAVAAATSAEAVAEVA